MRLNLLNWVVVLGLSVVLSGCFMPDKVKEIQGRDFPSNIHSTEQVKQAVLIAGKALNWEMTVITHQQIKATRYTGSSMAVVFIPFDISHYEINLHRSTNLNYNKANNTIKRSYNKDITDLSNAIAVSLFAQ